MNLARCTDSAKRMKHDAASNSNKYGKTNVANEHIYLKRYRQTNSLTSWNAKLNRWDYKKITQCDFEVTLLFYIDGLVQEKRNSIANALELRLSCTNPTIYASAISFVEAAIKSEKDYDPVFIVSGNGRIIQHLRLLRYLQIMLHIQFHAVRTFTCICISVLYCNV